MSAAHFTLIALFGVFFIPSLALLIVFVTAILDARLVDRLFGRIAARLTRGSRS